MKIRLCQYNQGSEQLLQKLKGPFPDLDIKLKKCAKQCKKCKHQPFALVDKELIHCTTNEELNKLIMQMIVEKTGC